MKAQVDALLEEASQVNGPEEDFQLSEGFRRAVLDEDEEIARDLQPEQNERSITRSHFDSPGAWEDWKVDHPQ